MSIVVDSIIWYNDNIQYKEAVVMRQSKLMLSESLKTLEAAITKTESVQATNISITDITEIDTGVRFILPNNTFSIKARDEYARKSLIAKNRVAAVIMLPTRLLDNTKLALVMLVLGNASGSVYMVDARRCFTVSAEHKQKYTLSEENIQDIAVACTTETKISKLVNVETIESLNYNLYPCNYIDLTIHTENSVNLNSVVKRVICGMELSIPEMKSIVTNEITEYRCLNTINIGNVTSAMQLPYIKMQDHYAPYIIPNHSLIITKRGDQSRIMVSHFDNVNVIATGTMYVLELDTDKINPEFLKVYLNSEAGQYQLDKCKYGTTLAILNLDALLNVKIPDIPMSQQKMIADMFSVTC